MPHRVALEQAMRRADHTFLVENPNSESYRCRKEAAEKKCDTRAWPQSPGKDQLDDNG